MMPMPPCRAMAMAILASVTVSIAADSSGVFNVMAFVSRLLVSTSEGMTSVACGTSRTSSYVKPR